MSISLISNSVDKSLQLGLSSWNSTQQFCGHTWSIADGGIRPLCTVLDLGGRISQLFIELFPSLDCVKSLNEVSTVCLGTKSLLSGFIVFYDLSPTSSQAASPRQKRFIQINNNVHWGLSKITSTLAPVSIVLSVLGPKSILLIAIKQANKLSLLFYHGTKVTKLFAATSSEKLFLHEALKNHAPLKEKLKLSFGFSIESDFDDFLKSIDEKLERENLPSTRISHAFTSACKSSEKTDRLFKTLFGESSFEGTHFTNLSNAQLIEELLTDFYNGDMKRSQIEFLIAQAPLDSEDIREGRSLAIKTTLKSLIKQLLSERHSFLKEQESSNSTELELINGLLQNDFLELVDAKINSLKNPSLLRESILKSCTSDDEQRLDQIPAENNQRYKALKKYITNYEKVQKHSHQMNENYLATAASVADFAVCALTYTVVPSALLCATLSSTAVVISTANWFYKRSQPPTPFADSDERVISISQQQLPITT
ncbi:MAG: hypothetical protein ACI9S8_001864 [Chlamydiales bacterium]|jgi:hypothetical protein